jgi:DNA-directed RNA polymerase specialized sigma54-like protein
VFKRTVVEMRLKELDTVIRQLNKYRDIKPDTIKQDLEERWVIERGIEARAQLILEIADHILSSQFGYYSKTYEDTLKGLLEKDVISEELYRQNIGNTSAAYRQCPRKERGTSDDHIELFRNLFPTYLTTKLTKTTKDSQRITKIITGSPQRHRDTEGF